MVGRTPEYLGKKIEAYDVKMAMLAVLIFPLVDPGLHGDLAVVAGRSARRHRSTIRAARPVRDPLRLHVGTGNNGSAFAGLSANTLWYNTTLGVAMLVGRFLMIIPMLAIAGTLRRKKVVPPSLGTFP